MDFSSGMTVEVQWKNGIYVLDLLQRDWYTFASLRGIMSEDGNSITFTNEYGSILNGSLERLAT